MAASVVPTRSTPDGIAVRAVHVSCSSLVVFSAWEPTGGYVDARHSTITHLDGGLRGRVGTTRPGGWLDELAPGSPERIEAAAGWYREDKARAVDAVWTAWPGLRRVGRADWDGGEVTCDAADLPVALAAVRMVRYSDDVDGCARCGRDMRPGQLVATVDDGFPEPRTFHFACLPVREQVPA